MQSKNILIVLLLLVCATQVYVIARLAPDEPTGPKEQCIPLYAETGYECCPK